MLHLQDKYRVRLNNTVRRLTRCPMNPPLFLRYETIFYWPWWICFIAIGFGLSRYFGWPGILASIFLISFLINGIELHSVFKDMRERPELERDADFVFWFGVLCRVVIYNAFVLPFGFLGWRLRARRSRVTRNATNVAEPPS